MRRRNITDWDIFFICEVCYRLCASVKLLRRLVSMSMIWFEVVRYVFFFSIAASRIHSFLADRPMEIPQQKVVSYFAKRGGKEIFCHGEGVQNSPGRKIRGWYLFSSKCTYFQGNIGKYFFVIFYSLGTHKFHDVGCPFPSFSLVPTNNHQRFSFTVIHFCVSFPYTSEAVLGKESSRRNSLFALYF